MDDKTKFTINLIKMILCSALSIFIGVILYFVYDAKPTSEPLFIFFNLTIVIGKLIVYFMFGLFLFFTLFYLVKVIKTLID